MLRLRETQHLEGLWFASSKVPSLYVLVWSKRCLLSPLGPGSCPWRERTVCWGARGCRTPPTGLPSGTLWGSSGRRARLQAWQCHVPWARVPSLLSSSGEAGQWLHRLSGLWSLCLPWRGPLGPCISSSLLSSHCLWKMGRVDPGRNPCVPTSRAPLAPLCSPSVVILPDLDPGLFLGEWGISPTSAPEPVTHAVSQAPQT